MGRLFSVLKTKRPTKVERASRRARLPKLQGRRRRGAGRLGRGAWTRRWAQGPGGCAGEENERGAHGSQASGPTRQGGGEKPLAAAAGMQGRGRALMGPSGPLGLGLG